MLVCVTMAVTMLKAFLLDAPLLATEKSESRNVKASCR